MTAPHARQPEVLPRPAWTPTAIQAVLAACADVLDVIEREIADEVQTRCPGDAVQRGPAAAIR